MLLRLLEVNVFVLSLGVRRFYNIFSDITLILLNVFLLLRRTFFSSWIICDILTDSLDFIDLFGRIRSVNRPLKVLRYLWSQYICIILGVIYNRFRLYKLNLRNKCIKVKYMCYSHLFYATITSICGLYICVIFLFHIDLYNILSMVRKW